MGPTSAAWLFLRAMAKVGGRTQLLSRGLGEPKHLGTGSWAVFQGCGWERRYCHSLAPLSISWLLDAPAGCRCMDKAPSSFWSIAGVPWLLLESGVSEWGDLGISEKYELCTFLHSFIMHLKSF